MQRTLKKQFAGEQILEFLKIFTNKLLFIEWILQLLRAVSIYLLKIKARIEVNDYAMVNETIDMRTASPVVKNNMIYDEEILKMRWDLCLGCEFLTDSNRCEKCGCFMQVKHKIATARCPMGKWDKYTERAKYATITS